MPDTRIFVVTCALAGALAVPLSAVGTPVSALIAALVSYVGLRIWRWSRLPALVTGNPPGARPAILNYTACFLIGLIVGLFALAVIRWFVEPSVPAAGARIAAAGILPLWRRLLIIYVAAVSEELVFRLILLSLIVGVTMKAMGRGDRPPARGVAHLANALSALAFGAVHLPAWTAVGLTPALILMVMALNGIAGLVLGHIFIRRGIVAAIWAHAGGDCAIQLIGPIT